MFDWNENEEVRGNTTWGELNESEDHIVPYPKGSKDDTLLGIGEHHKKQRHEQASSNLIAKEDRKFESKNDFLGSNSDRNSNFNTNEDLSAPRFDMDPWPDLPSLNSAFGKGYMDRNHLHSMSSKFIDSCTASPDVDTVTENLVTEFCDADGVIQNRELLFKDSCNLPASGLMDLDNEPDMFGNDHGDEEGGSFLNYDWSNIADFDDLDRIFRNNGSIFGHEIIGNADEFLSSPTDSISAITPPFSVPVDEQSGGEKKPMHEDKIADSTAAISRQIEHRSQLNDVSCEVHGHISDKADREKKLSKSRKKLEKKRTKLSQNLSSWPSNTGSIQQPESTIMQAPPISPQSFQSTAFCQQMGGGPVYTGFFHCASQNSLPSYRYTAHAFPMVPMLSPAHPERKESHPVPAHAFPMVPMLSPAHPERKESHPVPPSHTGLPEPSKHTSEVQSKSLTMTPQEKIEKLRRLQKMQAMLAIQQQHQQFGKQSTANEMSVSQTSSQMNRSHSVAVSSEKVDGVTETMTYSELNMPQGMDDSHKISILIDDSLGETIFYQLQEAIGKLDVGIRLCIRDSLFRLARSALERHSAGDRSSTNKSSRDEVAALTNETSSQDSTTGLSTETGTNPIDRTVAHLLFHGPTEPGTTVKDEAPPSSSNPGSKWSNTCDSVLEGKLEDAEELDIKPPL